MIISHKLEFIFIKTKKTASTSIEIALSRYCGPADVLTVINEEQLRSGPGSPGLQSDRMPTTHQPVDMEHGPSAFARYRGHMSAERILARTAQEVWDTYYKVAVDRNPWDKVVSFYFFRYRDSDVRPSFGEFVESGEYRKVGTMARYCINGSVAVDHVALYEDLDQEMVHLAQRLNLPEVPQLPNANAGIRPPNTLYRDLYDAASRETVARRFAREIETFGYEF